MSETIQNLEEKIKGQKLILRALKIEEHLRNKKAFIETAVGRGYLKTMQFLTRPFVNMNSSATEALSDPRSFVGGQLLKQANKLLSRAEETLEPDVKLAKALALCVIKIERHAEKNELDTQNLCELPILRREIERLRPPVESKKLEEFKGQIDGVLKITPVGTN